ncbi:hypothetical protein DSO57_1001235 [Entomophthora muscae]|uniref:Uncharacterized protein n=1 Tax=Entomophthora muscae TaxID=34485 RepID=A0ACC2SLY2_9FUNG|nr:hypothetical protein DSO57_1001235 [Entomophthora muscae]
MVAFSLLLTFLLAGQGSGQRFIGKGIGKVHGRIEGINKLLKLVVAEEMHNNNGLVGRESFSLAAPRRDYGITSNDVRYYLKHSLLSMCTPKDLESDRCFCKGKFEDAVIFKNRTLDSQAIVAADPANRLLVISYRMSVSEKNWDSNYKVDLARHPDLKGQEKVHRGHLEFFTSLYPQMKLAVLAMLKEPKYKDYKLHVTGYSLGASSAIISLPSWTRLLKENKLRNKIQLYSYSGPRPGNLEFAIYLENLGIPIVRYTKRGDVVPHVADQSAGYSQVGQEFYDTSLPLYPRELIKCSPNVMEDSRCSLKDYNFMATNHLTPFQKPLPLPPYC